MIPIRTLVKVGLWKMLIWMVVLPMGIATAQDGEKPFDPARSIANYGWPDDFSEVMERLGDGRLDPNFVVNTWYGHTVMHLVAPTTLEFLRMAVSKGGDCRVTDNFGTTPLHFAVSTNTQLPSERRSESVRILVNCGADVNAQDSRGATPLHAMYYGIEATPTTFANFADAPIEGWGENIVQVLLDSGAHPNIRDNEQNTPLLVVLTNRNPLFDSHVRLLLGGGADPNVHDSAGATPLTITLNFPSDSTGGRADIVSDLLEHGADPNLRDTAGDTPLIVTAMHKDDIVDETVLLLDSGADPCLRNSEGKLPYDLAKDGSKVKNLLHKAGGYFDQDIKMCARAAHELAAAEKILNLNRNDKKRVQVCLKRQGFDPGAPDGLFGPRTRKALQDWQVSQGSTGTESVGYLSPGQTEMLFGECKVALLPLCTDMTEGAQCWKETTNQPGCHIWDNNLYSAGTVTWSGSCDADGIAVGKGTSEWRNNGKVEIYTGRLTDGKNQGHFVVNYRGEIMEGSFVNGKLEGYWVWRGTQGENWFCMKDDEQVDGSECGVVEISERKVVVGRAVLRSGPGDRFERLGSIDDGEGVAATVRVGNRMWIETSDGKAGFVDALNLVESARRSIGERFRDCDECPEMVVVPAGSFLMGSFEGPNELPVNWVEISEPFAVGRFEVTFREWDACFWGVGCTHHPDDQGWGRGDRPVVNVSWWDAKEYVAWLSRQTGEHYRLLSESEWEYVARAGTRGRFHFGSTISLDQANFNDESIGRWYGKTLPVGGFPAANDFGLYDVHGNVWEWVEDCWHDNYHGAPSDGSAWTIGGNCSNRVTRGGSYYNGPSSVRSASRVSGETWHRNYGGGFRVARTLAP